MNAIAQPVVVWIALHAEAFLKSELQRTPGVHLQGFHDDPYAADYKPPEDWLQYIFDCLERPEVRLDAVIMNKKHKQTADDIRNFCMAKNIFMPKIIMAQRTAEACKLALEEVNAKGIPGQESTASMALPSPRNGKALSTPGYEVVYTAGSTRTSTRTPMRSSSSMMSEAHS